MGIVGRIPGWAREGSPYLSSMTKSRRLFRVPNVLVLAVLMACPFAGQAQESVQEQGEKFNTLLYYMNRM